VASGGGYGGPPPRRAAAAAGGSPSCPLTDPSPQPVEPARDALAHDRLGHVQLARDVLVLALVNDPRQHGRALILRQVRERVVEQLPRVNALERGERVVLEHEQRHPEPSPRARLDPPPLRAAAEHVSRDPEQPRHGRRAAGPEARAAEQRGREALGREIRRQLHVRRAPIEVPEHGALMARVELAERQRVPARPCQQLLVGDHPPVPTPTPCPCDAPG
jgi:hypothetical protein